MGCAEQKDKKFGCSMLSERKKRELTTGVNQYDYAVVQQLTKDVVEKRS